MNAVDIRSVTKRFGDFTAVENLSLSVPAGRVYGLLGPNGAGKTTTLRMVMSILAPDEGSVAVFGRPLDDPTKARIGYLPEDRGLYPKMKVADLILFLAEIKGARKDRARADMEAWLRRFDLWDWKDKKAEQLSKGMQQKVQFIVTVIHRPDLIILDEPFTGLDPVNTKFLKDIMLEFRDAGKTIVFSTHRMEQVEMLCDDIGLINKSRLVLAGSLAEIKRQYGKNTVVLEYEGDGSFVAGLPGVEKVDDYGKSMEIKLRDRADPQDILSRVVGRLRIGRFEIQAPSLNAIFIDKVGAGRE